MIILGQCPRRIDSQAAIVVSFLGKFVVELSVVLLRTTLIDLLPRLQREAKTTLSELTDYRWNLF